MKAVVNSLKPQELVNSLNESTKRENEKGFRVGRKITREQVREIFLSPFQTSLLRSSLGIEPTNYTMKKD